MRLYSRMDAVAVDDPQFGHFDLKDHGGFDLPDDLADRIGGTCVRGRRLWETELERSDRLHGEESARQRDPATLYSAVAELLGMAKKAGAAEAAADAAPAKAPAKAEPAAK